MEVTIKVRQRVVPVNPYPAQSLPWVAWANVPRAGGGIKSRYIYGDTEQEARDRLRVLLEDEGFTIIPAP